MSVCYLLIQSVCELLTGMSRDAVAQLDTNMSSLLLRLMLNVEIVEWHVVGRMLIPM